MGEGVGILMAMLSSTIGGGATAFIRFMVRSTDPVTLAALRFGSEFIRLLPVALWLRSPWPKGRDWAGVIGLGILFFGLCFALFNWALSFTTAIASTEAERWIQPTSAASAASRNDR
jgi:drug/metabolite transporter (DMT)-like permease